MSHPQPTMPPRQFSPQQHSPNQPYQLPPNKRARLSPGPPSNPGSPYPNYAPSPRATTPATTPMTLPSPAPAPNHNINQASAAATYNTPYQQPNGRSASVGMTLTMPTAVSTPPLASPQPQTPNVSHAPYSNAKLAPVPTNTSFTSSAHPVITNMGPPTMNPAGSFSSNDATRQGLKPTSTKADVTYDVDDMLVGTGIDLEEEAEYLNNLESRGFPNYPPGGPETLYGAGPANQPAQPTNAKTQEELAAESADRAWNDAAARLARTRSQEIANYLLEPGVVHKRMADTAAKYGLNLNVDLKPDGGRFMGKMASPAGAKPEIKVMYQKSPDGTMVQTLGSFIPHDAFLVDQIALLSISTKQHLRELVGDANRVATTRQKTSHGAVPSEWLDAAIIPSTDANGAQGEGPRTGVESAVSPRTNPLKRSADELSNGLPTPVSEASPVNPMVEAMTGTVKDARNAEEARLRKRLKRIEKSTDKDKEGGDSTSRAGSVAPGTPGLMAPDSGEAKAPTKKESKKAAKLAEASSTTVNQTLGLFAGGKKKKYSWMTNSGGPGSGASTPRPQAAGAPGTPGSTAAASSKAPRGPLTKAGVTHLGQFREDSDKGKNIQLRDWVVVIEERGFDMKALQQAYDILDRSAKGTVENTS
ncbi:hypothetical protein F4813DRAFT_360286 [Daldinia decipiens]|uniref:uncharacterized protein n=1 Tax=Daldinia decipiens TaxID=326647 RepID=UPI0020C1CD4F|nr:uncharacterized protein F4813DRAFT_360286 [Daldinia decipiens]KAI1657507.1 hypothetical protein F4813DRAFT_360286 [Daldinia decipiens]